MSPKRALLVTSNFPRWPDDSTTPFVRHLATDLDAQGWQIDVLAPHAPGARRVETMGPVKVRRFRYLLPESQQTVCYGGGALINLRENKINWIKVPFLALAELLATARLLAGGKYDVVNAHWILPQGFVAALAGKLTRTPLVITVHGGDVFDLRGGLLSRFKIWALRRAQAITVNSSATETAVRRLVPDAPLSRIPMGVAVPGELDAEAVAGISDTYRTGQGPLLLFVGRLVFEKGVADLLHAMVLIRGKMPQATLVIVGTGQDSSKLEALADRLDLSDHAHFVGWIDPDQVPTYMAAADIFVGPSKHSDSGWKEGLGLVFLEAMAVGTPVVATASGGIPDIVVGGETGLLVAEDAPEQIAAAVASLRDDPDLAATLAANGKEMVEGSFTRERSAASFAGLFDGVRHRSG